MDRPRMRVSSVVLGAADPKAPQMMLHLDIAVEDLLAGVAWALHAGATLADHQPQDHVRVLLDPAGHPFCLFQHSGQR